MDRETQQLLDAVRLRLREEEDKPLKVSIMGQTGVGKSSLLNALFNAGLKTDAVRPCTKDIERFVVRAPSGHELWFYDLPGIGESGTVDRHYLSQYGEKLVESDVVLWAIHADNRSVSFDSMALQRLLSLFDRTQQAALMSKITFVLTKVDLFSPPPWIFAVTETHGVFAPGESTETLLRQKERYFQEIFIAPYGDLMVSQTYNDTGARFQGSDLNSDEHTIYYRGYLDYDDVNRLKLMHRDHAAIFDRLHDNYRVVPCSSLFRYNLAKLMLVIINKLGASAINRFSGFAKESELNRVAIAEAKTFGNIVVYDPKLRRVLFDFSSARW